MVGGAGVLTQLGLFPGPAGFAAVLAIPPSGSFSYPTAALQFGLECPGHFHRHSPISGSSVPIPASFLPEAVRLAGSPSPVFQALLTHSPPGPRLLSPHCTAVGIAAHTADQ